MISVFKSYCLAFRNVPVRRSSLMQGRRHSLSRLSYCQSLKEKRCAATSVQRSVLRYSNNHFMVNGSKGITSVLVIVLRDSNEKVSCDA